MNFRYDPVEEKLIVSQASRIEYHQIKIWLSRKVKGWRFLPAVKMGLWNGEVSYFDNGKVNLGLWKECYKGCKEIDVTFNIENRDEFPINRDVTLQSVQEFCKDFFKYHRVKDKDGNLIPFIPYDYQIETAYKILKNRYCMAEVATSGGKSLIISIVFFYTLKRIDPNAKFLIIVPSINLVTQFYDNIMEYNYGQNMMSDADIRDRKIQALIEDNVGYSPCNIRIEEIMSDRPRKYSGVVSPNVYIGCYQSLEKWPKKFFEQFYGIATDEAHGAKSTTIKAILKRTVGTAKLRFGVSGTFPPDDSAEILGVQEYLGPKITQIEASLLMKQGTITPVKIKAILLNHNDNELASKLRKVKGADGAVVYQYEKKYVQASDKRLEFIGKITKAANNNMLILFHTIEYGGKLLEYLKKCCPDKEFHYIDGQINNKSREFIKAEMEKTDKVKILIASYGTLSTGVSIKNIHSIIFADSFKSESLIIQAIGRALRLFEGKKQAIIFDLIDIFENDPNNILYRQFLERESFYKKRSYPYEIKKISL